MSRLPRFRDREEAGRQLAERLAALRDQDPIVVGLPRGGVPVAAQIARALDAPLDVIVVRKVGVPFQPELGMGAVGEDGVRVVNRDVVQAAGVDEVAYARVEARERADVAARARRFRGDRPRVDLRGRTVVVVDDGLATGGTARAALQVARAHGAGRVVLAVPVAPATTVAELAADADAVVCLQTPEPFHAIGQWYVDFSPVPDDEVIAILAAAARAREPSPGAADVVDPDPPTRREIEIPVDSTSLLGDLGIPAEPIGLVLFAHGSGSSRHSPRNRFVAASLNRRRVATLLLDLLSPDEEADRRNVFDVALLADRLLAATAWAREVHSTLPVGYFGASTGAAAALWAAADEGDGIAAVVSRGGRPDLATARLSAVRAPTLLIVGGADDVVLELNRAAARQLRCEHRVEVVPGATHLFEEPGTLATVADLAGDWFVHHLAPLTEQTS